MPQLLLLLIGPRVADRPGVADCAVYDVQRALASFCFDARPVPRQASGEVGGSCFRMIIGHSRGMIFHSAVQVAIRPWTFDK